MHFLFWRSHIPSSFDSCWPVLLARAVSLQASEQLWSQQVFGLRSGTISDGAASFLSVFLLEHLLAPLFLFLKSTRCKETIRLSSCRLKEAFHPRMNVWVCWERCFRAVSIQDFNCGYQQHCYLRNALDVENVDKRNPEYTQSSLVFRKDNFHYPEGTYHHHTCLRAHRIATLPKSIVGNFCYCLSLAKFCCLFLFLPRLLASLSFYLYLFSCFCERWKLDEIAGVHTQAHVTGKIALDNRLLMKGSGLGLLSSAVGVSGGHSLWFWSPWYGGEKVGKSVPLRSAGRMCEVPKIHVLMLIYRNEEKGAYGASCTVVCKYSCFLVIIYFFLMLLYFLIYHGFGHCFYVARLFA